MIEFVKNAIKDYLKEYEVEKFFENPVKSFAELRGYRSIGKIRL